MSLKLFSHYIRLCKENDIKPNWEGVQAFQKLFRK